MYYITASDKYVDVTGSVKTSSPSPKTTSTSSSSSSIKSVGKIKIVGVSSAAIVMDKPDRNSSKNIGTVKLGSTISICGSVKGKNNSKGYWEVIYNGKVDISQDSSDQKSNYIQLSRRIFVDLMYQ
ncbi:hypothetical protein [Bacillus haynesii]|uniref:hypothetical protein n=1 Tax=Bacillus haynesii TaxID=1925021 RepID=UPI00398FB54A